MGNLITLKHWLELTYGEDAPTIGTGRRWAREGRIFPLPRKHGRNYFVARDARYVDDGKPTLIDRIRSGSAKA